jgi:hypothetical protein
MASSKVANLVARPTGFASSGKSSKGFPEGFLQQCNPIFFQKTSRAFHEI